VGTLTFNLHQAMADLILAKASHASPELGKQIEELRENGLSSTDIVYVLADIIQELNLN
jgi:hypothetical protein